MLDPLDFKNRPIVDRLRRLRLLTALTLLIERITAHFWRAGCWILFFAGLWLFEIPSAWGSPAPLAAAILFYAGIVYFTLGDIRFFRFPKTHEIDRRMERDSGLRHRPASGFGDRLANPAKMETKSLWQLSRKSVLSMLPRLKSAKPAAILARRDPFALRLAVVMFFGLAIFISGESSQEKIKTGLMPVTISKAEKKTANIALWITPPEYTGIQPLELTADTHPENLEIPEGSKLKVTAQGWGLGTPILSIGDNEQPLQKMDKNAFMLETQIAPGDTITLSQLYIPRASWDYKMIPDTPPKILNAGEFEILPDGAQRFPLTVYDDYGVQTLSMHMQLDNITGDPPPLGSEVTETRSVISPAKTEFKIAPVYDLTVHPWAGLPVTIGFEVEDYAGHKVQAEPIKLILPERHFSHPVAKTLIALRKKLIWSPLDDYGEITQTLEALLTAPGFFQNDPVVFLAIRSAASRARWSGPSLETAQSLASLLWDTALRVERDNLSLAAKNLRDAQQALEKALQNPDISQEEIARLMEDLRLAMAEYFSELQKELQKRMAEGRQLPMIPPEMMKNTLNPDALSQFLDQMESQMRSGDKKSAQEMLAQLQRLLDMMDPSVSRPWPPDMQMMSNGINELQELIERQQDLLSQTEDQSRNWSEEMDTSPHKAEQEALRFILGRLMLDAGEALKEIPENMGKAEQEMRGSSEALADNSPDLSLPHQEQAIEYLKKTQEDLQQQLSQKLQNMMGFGLSGAPMGYDPLGRPLGGDDQNGLLPGSKVQIPDETERNRAHEILKLLRQRSGEFDRPDEELEYFRRLLRQF